MTEWDGGEAAKIGSQRLAVRSWLRQQALQVVSCRSHLSGVKKVAQKEPIPCPAHVAGDNLSSTGCEYDKAEADTVVHVTGEAFP